MYTVYLGTAIYSYTLAALFVILQISLPAEITPRQGHSAVIFGSGPDFKLIVLFGGNETVYLSGVISQTTLLLLCKTNNYMNAKYYVRVEAKTLVVQLTYPAPAHIYHSMFMHPHVNIHNNLCVEQTYLPLIYNKFRTFPQVVYM